MRATTFWTSGKLGNCVQIISVWIPCCNPDDDGRLGSPLPERGYVLHSETGYGMGVVYGVPQWGMMAYSIYTIKYSDLMYYAFSSICQN
jgi:hypothetical protein